MNALELLAEIEALGGRLWLDGETSVGQRLRFEAPSGALDGLKAEMRAQKPALLALLALRAHAETRRRQIHWLCPDRRLFDLHRAAEDATGERLRFDGRGVSQRPTRRPEPAKLILESNAPGDAAPLNSVI